MFLHGNNVRECIRVFSSVVVLPTDHSVSARGVPWGIAGVGALSCVGYEFCLPRSSVCYMVVCRYPRMIMQQSPRYLYISIYLSIYLSTGGNHRTATEQYIKARSPVLAAGVDTTGQCLGGVTMAG